MTFKIFNPNPAGHKVGDCVVRAIVVMTGKDWNTVYSELCLLGAELKAMPSDQLTYEEYLKRNGYGKMRITVHKGSKRPTVTEMTKRSRRDNEDYICQIANHLTAIKDGVNLDLWDCGEKSLYAYWVKV